MSLSEELGVNLREVGKEPLFLGTCAVMKLVECFRYLDDLRKILRSQVDKCLGKSCQVISCAHDALWLPLQIGHQESEGCVGDSGCQDGELISCEI